MVPSSLTAAYLTELLARAGRLPGGGRVTAVTEETTRTTLISTLVRVRLEYAGDGKSAPTHLLIKSPRTDGAVSFIDEGRKEAAFYTEVAPHSPADVLTTCFEGVGSQGDGAGYIVVEDLSATHHVLSDWPVSPTRADCERFLESLARFHAAWWEHPALGASVGRFMEDAAFAAFVERFAARWTDFRTLLGDRLSPARTDRYVRLLRAMPRLFDRYRSRRHLTIVHGDAHWWNALFPNEGTEAVRIIDWADWRIDTASDDLAYMMALHWYPERRARLEAPLLRYYHDRLVVHGVRGYGFDALVDDYRLSAVWQMTVPVWQAAAKLPPVIWWSHLERAMLAFDDLGCAALLD